MVNPVIVNSAWKSKKPLETVTYQGEDYTIGINAFVTVEDAVLAGNTTDLVIVDKKLTTPFMTQGVVYEVEGAATDIFMSTETVSKDTDKLQFKATAGGTAKIESAALGDVTMVGFETVTSTSAGTFEGGKQDISATIKQNATTLDVNATAASTASGSLTVTDIGGMLTVAGIQDSGEFAGIALERIAGIHENSLLDFVGSPAADLDYMFTDDASYANVTLRGTVLMSGLQGGSITRKATEKTTENANGSATSAYTFSLTSKIGSGTATLNGVEFDVADEALVSGFKTVNINGGEYEDVNFLGGNTTQNNSLKTAYTPGSSFTSDYSSKVTETVAATVNAQGAEIDGVIEGFSTVALNDNTEVSQDIDSANVSVATTMKLSVKDQKGTDALSISYTQDFSKTAAGTLTAEDSAFQDEAEVDGMKTVSITDTTFSSDFSAVNTKAKFTKKETGTALAGIADETEIYTDNFNADFGTQQMPGQNIPTIIASNVDQGLVDIEEAYTVETASKVENSVGGTKFTVSGEASGHFTAEGYKTAEVNNTGDEILVANLDNGSTGLDPHYASTKKDITRKTSYDPGKTYSDANTYSFSAQAVGDATVTGNTSATVSGFAKATAKKSKDQTGVTTISATGLATTNRTISKTVTIKAATKKKLDGTLTETTTASQTAASSLTASDVTVVAGQNMKTVDLKNVTVTGGGFSGVRDGNSKSSKKVAWKADAVTAEEAIAADALTAYDEKVTSWETTLDRKASAVASFKLNDADPALLNDNFGVTDFKSVDITVAKTGVIANAATEADETIKNSFKRTISGSKTTQNLNNSSTTKAVASLKVTGKADNGQITMLAANQAWNSITLKDAAISDGDINANGVTTKYTVSTTANEDDDTVSVKVSRTYEASGSGKFSATVTDKDHVYSVMNGTMEGFSSITLSDNLSFNGIATNWKISGQEGSAYYVPFDGEYFDVIKDQGAAPDDALRLFGNVSGSYTVDKNENVTAQWKASASRTSSGSFTHTAKLAGVESAVQIGGYDKVTLTGIASVGIVEGGNTSKTFEYNYTLKNGDPTFSTKVTVKETSSSSVTVDGTGLANPAVAIGIKGYKAVTLANTLGGAELKAYNTDSTMTFLGAIEKLDYDAMSLEQKKEAAMSGKYSNTAAATLTATDSNLMGTAYGFQTVNLTDTTSEQGFVGGSETWTRDSKGETQTYAATGSFTATVDADEFQGAMTVGNVIGYKTVSLTNSSAQAGVFATNPEMEIPYTSYSISNGDAKKHPSATIKGDSKGNTFTAAAVDGDEFMVDNMVVGAVYGYEKVTATNLTSIGGISNYWMQDENDNIHYGSYTASGDLLTEKQTSASVKANGSATITGRSIYQMTQVTGDILGYSTVTLQNVRIGNGAETKYVSGDYTYTTKQNKSGEIIDSSETTTSVGKLSISNAEAVEDTEFSVSGFKDVAIDLTGGFAGVAAQFGDIIGGTTTNWDTATAGSLTLATLDGIVEGTVSGFDSVTFTNTSLGEDAEINGISAGKTTYEAKATVTFEDSTEAGNTIGGEINYAKTIVFKETKADDGDDFIVDAEIYSWAYGDTAIILEKGKATMDLSNFYLDEGDELNLSSAVSELTLGGDYDDLEAYFGNMKGASITGFGTIASEAAVGDVEKALEANLITVSPGVQIVQINQA